MIAALLAAPWYFLAAFCLFGGALIGCALWWLLVYAGDYLAQHEGKPVPPEHFCAVETRDPSKE